MTNKVFYGKKNYYSNFEIVKHRTKNIVSGWLAPNGTFYECGWGEHTDLAYEILKRNELYEQYRADKHYWNEHAGDFLIRRKFYILFDNPSRDEKTQKIVFNPFVRRTTIQVNKMFELIQDNKELMVVMMNKLERG